MRGSSGAPVHCNPTVAAVSRDARTGMQNGSPKSNVSGVADSTVVPLTENVPASNAEFIDPMAGPPAPLPPPKGGTMFRFFQIAPEKNEAGLSKEERDRRMAGMFEAAGAGHARLSMNRHPSMHRTESVDYIILLQGEVTCLLDVDEVHMKPFDVLIQRGTNHGWVNYGEEPALLVAVLIDAVPLDRV